MTASGGLPPRPAAPVGRDAELAAATAVLDAASSGPAAVVLSGQAGIGKSTIWRAIVAEAGHRGYVTLETRAVEAEAQLAFAGLADLLDPVLDEALPGLPPGQRLALEVALQRIPAGGVEPAPLAVALGFLGAVRALARAAPVVIAVDDLAWLDAPTARVLEYALRRIGDVGMAVAVTERVGPREVAPARALTGFPGPVTRLEVGPLDLEAIDEVIRRELALSLRRPALVRIQAESGGNPFVALEIARAMERSGQEAGPGIGLPAMAAGDLVRERLRALPQATRRSLAAAAALGRPSVDVLTAVAPDAGEALKAARAAGVVELTAGGIRFTHPLLAAGAYALLDAQERRELHGRLADVSTNVEERARHLALASDGASEAVAAELELAASGARRRGAPDAAAELMLQAARHTPPDDPESAGRRIVAAGVDLIRAGDPTRARAVLEERLAAVPPGPGRADALRVLADARSSDDWSAREELLREALGEAGPDHALRASILQALSQTLFARARDARGQLALASEAVSEADAQEEPVARCSAYLAAVFGHLSVGEDVPGDLLDRAKALGPAVEHLRIFMWPDYCEASTDETADRLERAAATLGRLLDRAAAAGDWDSPPLIRTLLGLVTYRLGRWPEAHEHAVAAERGQRVNGQAQGLAWALAIRARIDCGLGDEASARRAIEEGLALAREVDARATELELNLVAGVVARAAGDLVAAERLLRSGIQPLLDEGYRGPHLLWALPELAEVLVALDLAPEAAQLLDGYEEVARRIDRASALAAAHRVRGLIAAAAGREDDARSAFAEALGHHDRVPEPFARGRTLLAQGEALRRFRRRGEAREALGEAVAIFERLGARRWRERAAAELARTGHRDVGAALSPTEQQVAELVAAGRTNREVAEALFMSPHTVEAHLTRIYRSLGVRGRTDLARMIAAPSKGERAGPERVGPERASGHDGGYG